MKEKVEYILTLQLKKHKDQANFIYRYKGNSDDDIQGIKESVCMEMEEKYGTPIKCLKIKKSV